MEHPTLPAQTLIRKIKYPNNALEQSRRMGNLGLVECMSSQGYREWQPKYHINGRHSSTIRTLSDNYCPKCEQNSKVLCNLKCGQVTRGCLSGSCPARIVAVKVDNQGTMTVLHYEEIDTRRIRMPKLNNVLPRFADSQESDNRLIRI